MHRHKSHNLIIYALFYDLVLYETEIKEKIYPDLQNIFGLLRVILACFVSSKKLIMVRYYGQT